MRCDEVSTGLGWFIWALLAEQVVAWILSRTQITTESHGLSPSAPMSCLILTYQLLTKF